MDERYRCDHISLDLSPEEVVALVSIAEEAGEVVQAATKALKWGLKSWHPHQHPDRTNFVCLMEEVHDVMIAASTLQKIQFDRAERAKQF